MKRTLLIAIILAAGTLLSGCMIATYEEYRPARHHRHFGPPVEETIVVIPAPGPPPRAHWHHPHRRGW